MKPVIGIISYLPDNENIRTKRRRLLKNLLQKCSEIFNLPVIIIGQNWKDEDLTLLNYKINFYRYYDRLGIVGARNALREAFLSSDYDYLIMLDDDCILQGNKYDGDKYLKILNQHPDGFGEFNKTLLKLFAISKDIFSKEAFDSNINPENQDGFEDRIFVSKLRYKYPDKRFVITVPTLEEWSTSTADPNSTWYTEKVDNKKMLDKTINIINDYSKVKDS